MLHPFLCHLTQNSPAETPNRYIIWPPCLLAAMYSPSVPNRSSILCFLVELAQLPFFPSTHPGTLSRRRWMREASHEHLVQAWCWPWASIHAVTGNREDKTRQSIARVRWTVGVDAAAHTLPSSFYSINITHPVLSVFVSSAGTSGCICY